MNDIFVKGDDEKLAATHQKVEGKKAVNFGCRLL